MEPINPCVIESPFAGAVAWNKAYLRLCIRYCTRNGYTPYASHQMLPGALDDNDPAERELGMAAGRHYTKWALKNGAKWFVFADLGISPGMKETILALQADGFRPTIVLLSLDPEEPFDQSQLYNTAPLDARQEMRQTVSKTLNHAYEILGGFVEGLSDVALQRAYEAAPSEMEVPFPPPVTNEQGVHFVAEGDYMRTVIDEALTRPVSPTPPVSFSYEAQAARTVRTPEPEPAPAPASKFDEIVSEPEKKPRNPVVPVATKEQSTDGGHQAINLLRQRYSPIVYEALGTLTLPFKGTCADIIRTGKLTISPTLVGHGITGLMEDGRIDATRTLRGGQSTIYEIRGITGAGPKPEPPAPKPAPVVKAEPAPLPGPAASGIVPVGEQLTAARVIDVLVERGKIEALSAEACRILLGRPAIDMPEIQRVRSFLRTPTDQWVFSFRHEPRLGGEVWKLA